MVCREDNVSASVSEALSHADTPVEETAFAELRFEHLGPDIVNVVNDSRAAKPFIGKRDEEQKVRRVAEMDDFEAMAAPCLPSQAHLAPKRRNILANEPQKAASLLADPMAVNLNAFEFLLRGGEAAHLGADDDHLVACVAQGARLLPHPAIERHRQVLNDDQDCGLAHQQRPS